MWSSNHNRCGNLQLLAQSDVDVACARREVNQQVVQLAPIGECGQLLSDVRRNRPAHKCTAALSRFLVLGSHIPVATKHQATTQLHEPPACEAPTHSALKVHDRNRPVRHGFHTVVHEWVDGTIIFMLEHCASAVQCKAQHVSSRHWRSPQHAVSHHACLRVK